MLTYNGEAFGWLAFRLGSKYLSFMYNSKLEIISDDILKALLTKIYEYMINDNKETAYFWSSNSSTSEKLKLSGAELIDEIEDDSQFNLTKAFLEKI